jgi:hypothetical protein
MSSTSRFKRTSMAQLGGSTLVDNTLSDLHPERFSITDKINHLNDKFKFIASKASARFSATTLDRSRFSTTTFYHPYSKSSSKASFKADSTSAIFKHDNIVMSIFRNLEADTMANACGVCRNWNNKVTRLNILWQKQCLAHRIDLGPGIEQIECDRSVWFHRIFAISKLLSQNWKHSRYTIRCFPAVELRDSISWFASLHFLIHA